MGIEFDCIARTDRDKEAAKKLAEKLGFEKGIPTQLAEEIFIAGMNYKDDTSTNNILLNQLNKQGAR